MHNTVHSFEERLAWSQERHREDFWESCYRIAFPGFVGMVANDFDNAAQRMGVDRFLSLSSGKTLSVDEKVREKDWPDIALEYAHDGLSTPGWMEKDLKIDYLAYAFLPSRRVHLYPWDALRAGWLRHREEWMKKYPTVRAQNVGYATLSLAVPIAVVNRAVFRSLVIDVPQAVTA